MPDSKITMTSSRPYLVRAFNEWILDNDCTPYIVVDAGVQGVQVPTEHVANGQIVLNISPGAVRGLVIVMAPGIQRAFWRCADAGLHPPAGCHGCIRKGER